MASDKREVVLSLIVLIHKKSLAHSSPTIHYDKFRTIGLHHSVEFLTLSLSTNKFASHAHTVYLLTLAKVAFLWQQKEKNTRFSTQIYIKKGDLGRKSPIFDLNQVITCPVATGRTVV